jgi:hypothetical protein
LVAQSYRGLRRTSGSHQGFRPWRPGTCIGDGGAHPALAPQGLRGTRFRAGRRLVPAASRAVSRSDGRAVRLSCWSSLGCPKRPVRPRWWWPQTAVRRIA